MEAEAWFTADKVPPFTAFWDALEGHFDAITAAVRPEATRVAAAFADRPRFVEDVREMFPVVRQSLEDGDWTRVTSRFEARGALLAGQGLNMDQWIDVILASQTHTMPWLVRAHADPKALGDVVMAMQRFWRRTIRTSRRGYERERARLEDESRAALRRSEARYTRLVESGIVGVMIGDLTGQIHDANDAFLRLVGYTRDELRAGILRWDHLTPPEWDLVNAQIGEDLQRTGASPPREKEYLRKDGSRVRVLVGAATLEPPDVNITFVLDITDRVRAEAALERSERLFRAIVENSPDAVGLLDRDANFLYASPNSPRVTGQSEQELIGRSAFDLIAPADLPGYLEQWQLCVARPGVRMHHEFRLRRPGGKFARLESVRTNLLDDPNIRAVVTLVRDVTEQRQLQEQLRQSQKIPGAGSATTSMANGVDSARP